MRECVILDPKDLLPEAWRRFSAGPVWMFNASLLRDGDGWIFAYRVIGPDLVRRIALCRLDRAFRVVAGSPVPFTDLVRFAPGSDFSERTRSWFADPRFFRMGGRLWLYWNSGWHDPRNHQFIQGIDAARLSPIGFPREWVLSGQRKPLEKNWTLFGDGPFHAVYSINPHRILRFSPDGPGDVIFEDEVSTAWKDGGYAARYGELRGGAAPQRLGDHYYSFCHSHYHTPAGLCYAAAVYRFSASPPFAPDGVPFGPLKLGNPFGDKNLQERLNPVVGEVIYPCGAVHDEGRWVVSYGINDEHCAICVVPHAEVLASLRGLPP